MQALQARADRGNKMLEALKVETDRGCACVVDALLDELLKQLFHSRLIDKKKEVEELLSPNQALGSHGARLKLAYFLGWIGLRTYSDARSIHKVRNKMAHRLDVDAFEHKEVRDLVDGFLSL